MHHAAHAARRSFSPKEGKKRKGRAAGEVGLVRVDVTPVVFDRATGPRRPDGAGRFPTVGQQSKLSSRRPRTRREGSCRAPPTRDTYTLRWDRGFVNLCRGDKFYQGSVANTARPRAPVNHRRRGECPGARVHRDLTASASSNARAKADQQRRGPGPRPRPRPRSPRISWSPEEFSYGAAEDARLPSAEQPADQNNENPGAGSGTEPPRATTRRDDTHVEQSITHRDLPLVFAVYNALAGRTVLN